MNTILDDAKLVATLRRRIRQFYLRLQAGDFEKCYQTLDPDLRASPEAITSHQYTMSLRRFLDSVGEINLGAIEVIGIHLNEPNRLYNNRDFARLEVSWEDSAGISHTFKERWVRGADGRWYTRSTGFVVPEPRKQA